MFSAHMFFREFADFAINEVYFGIEICIIQFLFCANKLDFQYFGYSQWIFWIIQVDRFDFPSGFVEFVGFSKWIFRFPKSKMHLEIDDEF